MKKKNKNYFQPRLPFKELKELSKTDYEKIFFKLPIGKKKGQFIEIILFQNPIYLIRLKRFIVENKIFKFYFVAKKIDEIFDKVDKIKIEGFCERCNAQKIDYFVLTKTGKIIFLCKECCRNLEKNEEIIKKGYRYSFVLNLERHQSKEFIKKFKEKLGIKKISNKKIYNLLYELQQQQEEEEEED